ncbi:MAG: TatD family hydrolase [Pseudomonadota bacterium]
MRMWIDSHCHLDAPDWTDEQRLALRRQARAAGVEVCVYPAVERANWARVRELAHATGDAYALGIHPLYAVRAADADLEALAQELQRCHADPQLVAVGEIGLDFLVPALCAPAARQRQWHFYTAQLELAQRVGLPVILHVRRSADELLRGLRQSGRGWSGAATADPATRLARACGGIAHAFSGSLQQAQAFIELGFALGFGGACTFEAARRLRRLASALPAEALVLETDAPDMPPQWLYTPAAARAGGAKQAPNTPAELARIGATLAALRGLDCAALAAQTSANVRRVLPRLAALRPQPPVGAAP